MSDIKLLFDWELTDTQAHYIKANLSQAMLIKIRRNEHENDADKIRQITGMIMVEILSKLGVE
jgi:hypothetical protein